MLPTLAGILALLAGLTMSQVVVKARTLLVKIAAKQSAGARPAVTDDQLSAGI